MIRICTMVSARGAVAIALTLWTASGICAIPSDSVWQLARAGDLARARTLAQQIFAADSSAPQNRLAYAVFALSEKQSRTVLQALWADSSLPAALRIDISMRLGDMAFIRRTYSEAAEHYNRSLAISSGTRVALRAAISLLAADRTDSLEPLINTVAQTDSTLAGYIRALNLFATEDYANGLRLFSDISRRASQPLHLRIASSAGAALCANRMGYVSQAAQYRQETERLWPGSLEQALFAQGFTSLPETKTARPAAVGSALVTPPTTPPVSASSQEENFTIQIGSFGAVANAKRLQEKVRDDLPGVRVIEGAVNGTSYYRVRIGTFPSRELAEDYAREHVAKRGLSYKVLSE